MKSTADNGMIQISKATAMELERGPSSMTGSYSVSKRGFIDVKGKGKCETYFVVKRGARSPNSSSSSEALSLQTDDLVRKSLEPELDRNGHVGAMTPDKPQRKP